MTEQISDTSWVAILVAQVHDGASHELRSPHVGLWRGHRASGTPVVPGLELGVLEVLGVLHRVVAPDGAVGSVGRAVSESGARVPVSFGELLVTLEPGGSLAGTPRSTAASRSADAGDALVYCASMSGRFYSRPAPDKAPYASEGQIVQRGDTVGLLEVMKTFTRLVYGGAQLPAKARITRILPAEGADLNAGDPILELERAK